MPRLNPWPARVVSILMTFAPVSAALAQATPAPVDSRTCRPQSGPAPSPSYLPVEQLADGRVTFRLCAPEAVAVAVISADVADVIPMGTADSPGGLPMIKDQTGLWSVTTGKPIAPDNYRFNFYVDGVAVPDPRGADFTRARNGVSGLFEVMGPAGAFQTYQKDVPHGAVSVIEYWSKSLGSKRRAKVYTPPGYMKGTGSFPVLYLVHGAGDSDDSWTAVGHANYILDNLIAAGKAKRMIVVMPFGHTPERPNANAANLLVNQDFGSDLIEDLIPFIDANYRTVARADARAMAGLSMGGAHTLNYGLTHPELFHYIGVFSMGLGLRDPAEVERYVSRNDAVLRRGARQFKLVYYAVGRSDFLYPSAAPTRAMLDKVGIHYVYNESDGGHTWINWRRYFNDFAPRLFQ